MSNTNAEISAREVAAFKADKPANYFLYVSLDPDKLLPLGSPKEYGTVTTWTGERLGTIYFLGHVWNSNMGDRRRTIKFRGINGLSYWGTYYCGAGDYARVKAYKS